MIVFAALDEAGRPVGVPPWKPKTATAKAMHGYAERLMLLGRNLEEEMRPHLPQVKARRTAVARTHRSG